MQERAPESAGVIAEPEALDEPEPEPEIPGEPEPSSAGQSPQAPAWYAWWNRAAIALPVALIAVLGYERRWLSDDGLIYTRVVRQILAGHGPVINVGERAEAATGTLWQWLVAAAAFITRADPARVAVGLGLACTVAGFYIALDAARRLHGADRLLVPAGVLALLALPPVWDFATSGLESGLSTLWLAIVWWTLVVRARTPTKGTGTKVTGAKDTGTKDTGSKGIGRLLAAVVLGLGPLVRPEFGLVTVVLGLAWLRLERPGRWEALRLIAVGLVAPVGYEIFRAGYYGVFVPLPALSKSAGTARLSRGLTYLGDLIGPYELWLPLLIIAGLAVMLVVTRRQSAPTTAILVAAPTACGIALTLYVVWVGGDFMHGRTLLPGLFLLVLPVALVPLPEVENQRLLVPAVTVTGLGVLAIWSIICGTSLRVPYDVTDPNTGIGDERAFNTTLAHIAHPDSQAVHAAHDPETLVADQALALDQRVLVLPDGTVVPLRPDISAGFALSWPALGINGVLTPLDGLSVDDMGLGYPLAAHMKATGVGRAGHDRLLPDVWIMADYGDPAAPAPPGIDPVQLAAARRALHCGALAALQESVRAPMSFGRFWDNLWGAASRSKFTFPADPVAAERKFCGTSR